MTNEQETPVVAAARAKIDAASSPEEARSLARQAITDRILGAMNAAKLPKAEKAIEALRDAGLDDLLLEGLRRGRVTHQAADRHLNRLRTAIRERRLPVQLVKDGLVAFDVIAQRLALAGGKNSPFQYRYHGNAARDSLTTFASALHR